MQDELNKYPNDLFQELCSLIETSKKKMAVSVNTELAFLYWSVGVSINKHVLHSERADYGKQVVKNTAQKLSEKYGKGWSAIQLRHCLRNAETIKLNTAKDFST